eukprot:TRINITY_DN2092_c0_g1_i4.p1 TRINITY_DN2092_c0_g1~~TRINITY_DN2092_c0_g1_i4.p1  ORF type:complete len:744 (-),score=113.07 TRINITY_DN2092_c0_g1_i4:20-2251(-)
MYLTNNYICFTSKLMTNQLIFNFNDITDIRLETLGLRITHINNNYSFSILSNNEAYNLLCYIWNNKMNQRLQKTESLLRKDERMAYNYIPDSPRPNSKKKAKLVGFHGIKHYREILEQEYFFNYFRIPEDGFKSKLSVGYLKRNNSWIAGELYLSENYLGFFSKLKLFNVLIVLYGIDEFNIKQFVKGESEMYSAELVGYITVHMKFSSESDRRKVCNQWTDVKHKNLFFFNSSVFLTITGCDPENPLELRKLGSVSDKYKSRQLKKLAKWDAYLEKEEFGFAVVNKRLINLISRGIPDSYRGSVWKILSGVSLYKSVYPEDYYQNILNMNINSHSVATEQISRDIYRSLPNHPYFQKEEGISKLNNVLTAYSWRNPVIGYCQSMNIIAAVLLLFMDEEDCFYTLCSICEIIMPQYYNRAMTGSMVDSYMFSEMVEEHLPEMHKKFEAFDIPLAALTLPWFLCIFIGYIPPSAYLSLVDMYFYYGTDVIFRMGLSILYLKKDDILACTNADQICRLIRDGLDLPSSTLLRLTNQYMNISGENMPTRLFHKNKTINDLVMSIKQHKVNSLLNNVHFNKDELDVLFHEVQHSTYDFYLTKEAFRSIFSKYCTFWLNNEQENVADLFYNYMKPDEAPKLGYGPLVQGLSQICKGNVREKFLVCFYIYDTNRSGMLNRGELVKCLKLLFCIYKPIFDNEEVIVLVKILFDKLSEMEGKQSELVCVDFIFEQFFDKPILLEFLNITEE